MAIKIIAITLIISLPIILLFTFLTKNMYRSINISKENLLKCNFTNSEFINNSLD